MGLVIAYKVKLTPFDTTVAGNIVVIIVVNVVVVRGVEIADLLGNVLHTKVL